MLISTQVPGSRSRLSVPTAAIARSSEVRASSTLPGAHRLNSPVTAYTRPRLSATSISAGTSLLGYWMATVNSAPGSPLVMRQRSITS